MIQQIKYNGLTASPSDYDAPDGDLALALNLCPDKSALVPLSQPYEFKGQSDGALSAKEARYIHRTSQFTHFIIVTEDNTLAFIDAKINNGAVSVKAQVPFNDNSATYSDIKDVSSIGNTLIIATEQGLCYFLWKDSNYISLGHHVPEVHLCFGLAGEMRYRQREITFDNKFKYDQDVANGGPFSYDHAKTITDGAWACLESQVAEEATQVGKFCYPFFIRYALRLYDDSLVNHSAPIFMTPNSIGPWIRLLNWIHSSNDYVSGAYLTGQFVAAAIEYQVLSSTDAYMLNQWRDIVKSVDIFVSPPISTMVKDGSVPLRLLKPTEFQNGKFVGRLLVEGAGFNTLGGKIARAPISNYDKISQNFCEWTYAQLNALFFAADRTYIPLTVNLPRISSDDFDKAVKSQGRFYKLATISLEEIDRKWKSGEGFTELSIDKADRDLSNLQIRELMSDDYLSHDTLSAGKLSAYNNKLNLMNVARSPYSGFPARSMFAMCNCDFNLVKGAEIASWGATQIDFRPNYPHGVSMKITTFIEEDGVKYSVESNEYRSIFESDRFLRNILSPENADGTLDPTSWGCYVFYPNVNAYKMLIECDGADSRDNCSYLFDLEPHDFLNGAVAYLGREVRRSKNYTTDNLPTSSLLPPIVLSESEKIYISTINNPFIFAATGRNSLGADVGTVFATCTAAKALSQGQFGQFPLYAFTDAGVWALEVGADGNYTARQPITRDVCINPNGITQIDSAVLFPTNRGIMLISGSECRCISDAINTEFPFDVSQLPHLEELHRRLDHDVALDRCLPLLPFTRFLEECRMIYDYVHQRIIVYNDSVTYAYIYSLRSNQWGMMYCNIANGLNSYPNALAITRAGKLVDFSFDDPAPKTVTTLLVTRPIKLGDGDLLKTVNTVIQRGNFARGHVQSIIYGSRDLRNWHTVWSSKDHHLHGFRGSPYKFFRLALLCTLHPSESLTGATIQFTPRQTNRLH
ncbi:MAG: hypothetical protein K2I18_08630 [Paramuribaculum sp.]|nr:hypothetical protein [Paramuribaculum sp.]